MTLAPPSAPQYPAVAALGAVFDVLNVCPGLLRAWAAMWLSCSEERILALAMARGGRIVAAPPRPPESTAGLWTTQL